MVSIHAETARTSPRIPGLACRSGRIRDPLAASRGCAIASGYFAEITQFGARRHGRPAYGRQDEPAPETTLEV